MKNLIGNLGALNATVATARLFLFITSINAYLLLIVQYLVTTSFENKHSLALHEVYYIRTRQISLCQINQKREDILFLFIYLTFNSTFNKYFLKYFYHPM